MRAVLWGLVLLLAGCSARQECATTCKGCCDLAGECQPGTDPYACGSARDCSTCRVGQSCAPGDAGNTCTGPEQVEVLQLTGNNAFVAVSAQGFTYESTGAPFLLISNRDRKVCRNPSAMPKVNEEVLVVNDVGSNPLPSTPSGLEHLIFSDAGVGRFEVKGTALVRTEGTRIKGSLHIDSPPLKLDGTIDAPFCGEYR